MLVRAPTYSRSMLGINTSRIVMHHVMACALFDIALVTPPDTIFLAKSGVSYTIYSSEMNTDYVPLRGGRGGEHSFGAHRKLRQSVCPRTRGFWLLRLGTKGTHLFVAFSLSLLPRYAPSLSFKRTVSAVSANFSASRSSDTLG